jgi:transcriptional regulator with XRE-family HTH domain
MTYQVLKVGSLIAILLVKSSLVLLMLDFKYMKVRQSATLPPELVSESKRVGQLMGRLRLARKVKQTEAALRSGLSRNTAYRIEKGDPGVAFGQILRYLEAIAPGSTLADLLTATDPALASLQAREQSKRVRELTASELEELNF